MDRMAEISQMMHEERHVLQWYAPDLASKPPAIWAREDLERWNAFKRAYVERAQRRIDASGGRHDRRD